MTLPYRPSVIGVFLQDGLILCGERSDYPGSWQLPQGGIDPGESPEVAIVREMQEELGCGEVHIRHRLSEPICYDFPDHLNMPLKKSYCGQEQHWFVLAFAGPEHHPNLEQADAEFRDIAWKTPEVVLQGIVDWKRDAYLKAFMQLGIVPS